MSKTVDTDKKPYVLMDIPEELLNTTGQNADFLKEFKKVGNYKDAYKSFIKKQIAHSS